GPDGVAGGGVVAAQVELRRRAIGCPGATGEQTGGRAGADGGEERRAVSRERSRLFTHRRVAPETARRPYDLDTSRCRGPFRNGIPGISAGHTPFRGTYETVRAVRRRRNPSAGR